MKKCCHVKFTPVTLFDRLDDNLFRELEASNYARVVAVQVHMPREATNRT